MGVWEIDYCGIREVVFLLARDCSGKPAAGINWFFTNNLARTWSGKPVGVVVECGEGCCSSLNIFCF